MGEAWGAAGRRLGGNCSCISTSAPIALTDIELETGCLLPIPPFDCLNNQCKVLLTRRILIFVVLSVGCIKVTARTTSDILCLTMTMSWMFGEAKKQRMQNQIVFSLCFCFPRQSLNQPSGASVGHVPTDSPSSSPTLSFPDKLKPDGGTEALRNHAVTTNPPGWPDPFSFFI